MKHFKISKLIHFIHLIGVGIVMVTWLYLLLTFQVIHLIVLTTCIINFIHPRHTCIMTHLENKYRTKAGKERIKWIKHYILSKDLFRKD